MAESGGLCLGKPVLVDNCTGSPRKAESGGLCLGKSVLVDNSTELSQNDWIKGVLSRETCFSGQNLPEVDNCTGQSHNGRSRGFCLARPVVVDSCKELVSLVLWTLAQNPAKMAESGGVLSGETCFGGQLHRTPPEWLNQRTSV